MADGPRRSLRAWPRRGWVISTRRVLLLAASAGVLIAAVVAVVRFAGSDSQRLTASADPERAFRGARTGDCLNWPPNSPDQASIVSCATEHRFEVAGWVDGESATSPAPISSIQEISHQQCQAAVHRYLGDHYDPDGRFTVGVLWTGNTPAGERHLLCGLQWPGPGYQQSVFAGRVSELDWSKVWPAGTCLGFVAGANRSSGIPVDCSAPHAMEVTGTVNLAEKFSGPSPDDADQSSFVDDACARITDAWLGPVALSATALTLSHETIPASSWTAGSHQLACKIGAPLDGGGWATLTGSAKGPLSINGQPAAPSTTTAPGPNPAPAPNPSTTTAPSTPTTRQTAPTASPPVTAPETQAPTEAGGGPDTPPSGPPAGPPDNPQTSESPPPPPPTEPPPPSPTAPPPPSTTEPPPPSPTEPPPPSPTEPPPAARARPAG